MSSISGVGGMGSSAMMMQGMGGMKRPEPAQMAADLFSQIDTAGQGYIEKADLQSAYDKVSSADGAASADDLFSALDTDSDGKVTKQEFSDSLKKLQDSFEEAFQNGRMEMAMQAGGMGGMPPPPSNDAGFSKEELSGQLEAIGSSDSKRSAFIASIVDNFDQADGDGDGKVSFKEAMSFREAASAQDAASTASASTSNEKLVTQIMKLAHAYMQEDGATASTISVSA